MDKEKVEKWLENQREELLEEVGRGRFHELFILGIQYQTALLQKMIKDGLFD